MSGERPSNGACRSNMNDALAIDNLLGAPSRCTPKAFHTVVRRAEKPTISRRLRSARVSFISAETRPCFAATHSWQRRSAVCSSRSRARDLFLLVLATSWARSAAMADDVSPAGMIGLLRTGWATADMTTTEMTTSDK
jgi:hypothetical protein